MTEPSVPSESLVFAEDTSPMNGPVSQPDPIPNGRTPEQHEADQLSPDAEVERFAEQYQEVVQLVGGFAHEIRNPLSSMRLNLDLLAEQLDRVYKDHPDDPSEARTRTLLDRVRHENRRLQGILDDFLQFARLHDLETEPIDLNEVVGVVTDFCAPQAEQQDVTLRTHFAAGLGTSPLDVDRFEQALLNLVLNALQVMPDGGELIVSTRAEGNWNCVDVTDSGPGIPHRLQDRIFDAFFSTRDGGTGLGLPTTRRIIEAHGGQLRLQSEPGKGTRFTIRLPRSDGSGDRT